MLLTLIPGVSAFSVVFNIQDINTKNNLESVLITVVGNETQPIAVGTSDVDGLLNLTINETLTFYDTSYSKVGYHSSYNNNYTWVGDDTENKYLYPISDDGIVRIRFHDLTGQSRQYCLLYAENDRLEGCYSMNETPQVLVNSHIKVVPEISMYDIISSRVGLEKNIMLVAGITLIVILGAAFLALPITILKLVWRKR